MSTAYVIVTAIMVAASVSIAVADLIPASFVIDNSAEVGVSRSALPTLAALKIAGALGLLIGLLGVEALGVIAAAGLVLFFVGAIVAHVRAGVYYNIYFPAFYLALAVATLVLHITK